MVLDLDAFARRAREIADAIPPEFMEGIDAVEVHEEEQVHPHLEGIWTLGTCETSHLSDPTGQEPFRSVVHVYYGSFVAMAREDPSFDVEAELEETIHHEVQHHIEDRAGEDRLRDEDELFEVHARFRAGMDVPTGWYRFGDPLEPALWAVDLDLFLELDMPRARFEAARGQRLTIALLGDTVEVDLPADAREDEIWTLEGEGLLDGGDEDEDDGDDEGDGDADAEPSGPVGDLHVIPIVR